MISCGEYLDHMNFATFVAFSFITFFHIPLVPFFGIIYIYIYIWLYVLYASVSFCKLCIFIVMFMYSYCYVCSLPDILFHFVVLVLFVCKCVLYY